MNALADTWGQVALAVTWQLAVLAVVALLAERLLRLRDPRVRHALWWFVLLAPLVLAPGRLMLAERGRSVRVPVLPREVAHFDTTARLSLSPYLPLTSLPEVPELHTNGAPVEQPTTLSLTLLLLSVWAGGVAFGLVRLGFGWRQVRRLLRACRPITDGPMAHTLASLCAEAGIRSKVPLLASEEVGAPLLYGGRRPVLILPEGWLEDVPSQDLESFLAHEVAHIVRRDGSANLFQRVLEALLFFHPFAWLASRRLSMAREELCDTWALARGTDPYDYANALTSAATLALGRLPGFSVGLAENRFVLLRRVEAILKGRLRRPTARGALLFLLAAVLATAAVCAVAQVAHRADPDSPRPMRPGDYAAEAKQQAAHEKAWLAQQDASKARKVTFSGRVVDSAGQPVVGADLWLYVGWEEMQRDALYSYSPRGVFLSREIGVAGGGGRFSVTVPIISNCPDLPVKEPWAAVVIAHHPTRGLAWTQVVGPASRLTVNLTTGKATDLRGRIVGPEGKPLPKATAQISEIRLPVSGGGSNTLITGGGPRKAPPWTRASADKNGELLFAGLPAKAIVSLNTTLSGVEVSLPEDLVSSPTTVNLATQRWPLTLPFGHPIVIEGDLKRPNGAVAAKIRVRLTGEWRAGDHGARTGDNTWSDEVGHFKFTLSQPATYTVTVQDQNLYAVVLKELKITALGQQVHLPPTILQPGGTVEGRVINSVTKQPIPGVAVFCRPEPDPNPWLAATTETASTTDEEGRYYLSAPPGKVRVYASPQEHEGFGTSVLVERVRVGDREAISLVDNTEEPSERSLDVAPNALLQGLDLFLTPMVPVTGIARRADGKPLAGARATVRVDTPARMEYRWYWWQWGDTKADGTFSGFGYPGVPLKVIVWDGKTDLGGAATVTPRWPKSASLSVTVRPMLPVTGRVLQSNGQPAAGASAHFSELGLIERNSLTDKAGRFRRTRGIPGVSFDVVAAWPPHSVARQQGLKGPREMGRSKPQLIAPGARGLDVGDVVMEPYEQLLRRWEREEKERTK